MQKVIRIGGPYFEKLKDFRSFIKYHQDHGWAAAYCPYIPDSDLQLAFKGACHEADIILAEVWAFHINITDLNEKLKKENIEKIVRMLEYAENMEAKCLLINGGTAEMGNWGKTSPENFTNVQYHRNVQAIKEILNAVNPKKTKLALELSPITFPYSPENYKEFLNAVNHHAFAVHLDPFKLLTSPTSCLRNQFVLKESIELLGSSIISSHANDVAVKNWYNPIEIIETIPGEGLTDYMTYLNELTKCPNDVPLMIDSVSKKQLLDVNEFLFEACMKAEISVKHAEFRKRKKMVLQPLEI